MARPPIHASPLCDYGNRKCCRVQTARFSTQRRKDAERLQRFAKKCMTPIPSNGHSMKMTIPSFRSFVFLSFFASLRLCVEKPSPNLLSPIGHLSVAPTLTFGIHHLRSLLSGTRSHGVSNRITSETASGRARRLCASRIRSRNVRSVSKRRISSRR